MGNLTTKQLENVVLDAGVIYINYGLTDERVLAPCREGIVFVVEQEFKDIEYDGQRGKTKGMRRIISENASITANVMDLSQENIKLALAGSNMDGTTKAITNGTGEIASADYLANITAVGLNMKGEYKVITLYNAMADNGLNIEMNDKEEASIELQFSAHYDPTNLSSPIYKIEQVTTLA
ncbi:hypothetical protein [Acetivibrio cellulolyticus]|uniref:hypothetical protein n=1 Tax=Acetivibrio cellulolyticus TaxID=35830 RepID=UPI0001E2C293|nr:hypothetical protein [Acetivibrio cellulolyticus]